MGGDGLEVIWKWFFLPLWENSSGVTGAGRAGEHWDGPGRSRRRKRKGRKPQGDGFVLQVLCRLCLAAPELGAMLLPWIHSRGSVAGMRSSPGAGAWNESLEQPLARTGVTHRDFTAPTLIKAQKTVPFQFPG